VTSNVTSVLRVAAAVAAVVIGFLAMIAGGFDDSPGLQGLGLILIVVTLIRAYRQRRRRSMRSK
jgi:preprotein translocase subunit SecY